MNILVTIILWITYVLSLYITIYWMVVFFTEEDSKKDSKRISLARFPPVSILIPAYNEENTIALSLESVIKIEYPKDKLEIIVINDGSKDNTEKKINEFIKSNKEFNIKLINQKNLGKANALNNALKTAKGEFFACLDADSFVEPKTLKKMLKVYEEDSKKLAIVIPAMKVKSPRTFIQKIQWTEYLVSLFIARLMSRMDCIYVAPGPFSLYRTDIIRKLGGFDTKNLTEDQEIAYRVQKNHYKIKQGYDSYVYTIAPRDLKELYKQRNRWLKGSFLNIVKYRKLIWNKKYGDFGIMQMSINLALFFLGITTLFFFFFYAFKPLYEFIKNIYIINFDIKPFLKETGMFNFTILNLDIEKIVIIYFLLLVSFSIVYLAHKNANEKFRIESIIPLLTYFLVYYILISFIMVMIFFELLFDKKHRWEH